MTGAGDTALDRLRAGGKDGWRPVGDHAFVQVGWIDEYGNLWSLGLRNGSVPTDKPVYAAFVIGDDE